MLRFLVGAFIVLHGLVHLLYWGQSARYFELQPGMTWPDGSWAFSPFLGDEAIRKLASVLLIVAAISFVAGGIGIFAQQAWWRPVVVGSAAFFAAVLVLLWNGQVQKLDNQGAIGVLINAVILVAVLVFQWPNLELVNK
jgi:hypothetical protein